MCAFAVSHRRARGTNGVTLRGGIFLPETEEPLLIANGGIVRADYPLNESLQDLKQLVEQDASDVILMSDIR